MSAILLERTQKAASIMMGKSYELSLTKDYVARWGMLQAIRELIQNALDSESPFVYEFRKEDDSWALILNSEFTTLTPQTLLLGMTSKADAENAIGSFGEGYKIALLVLTREGYDVEMRNGDLLWRPHFKYSRTFGTEVLAIAETFAPDKTNHGLTFIVHGLDDSAVVSIRESCLRMQDSIGAIKQTKYGDILLDQPGKLYVGSLYICETELKYGYNIMPKHMTLERDRQTVSNYDLKNITMQCWLETGENDRIAKMIFEEVADVEYIHYDTPDLVKEECYQIFRAQHPDSIIASSPEEAKKKIAEGLVKTIYIGGDMYHAVSESRSYKAEKWTQVKPPALPHQVLAKFLSKHRGEMQTKAIVAMKELIKEAEKEWRLK